MSATFRILGPLEVLDGSRMVTLGGLKQRALLAVLLLHPNEVLSTDRLIDLLWGDAPPPTARQTVQVYISQLRRAISTDDEHGARIETRPPGYVLCLRPGMRDLDRFDELAAAGRQALAAGDPAGAAATLGKALSMWRGPPLADFTYEPFAQREIARLEERRVACVEDRIDADLDLGRNGELVGELEQLVAEHPMRERMRGQLMLALYRSGRQAEALACYSVGRTVLTEELGIEPGGALKDLERRILNHDPTLAPMRTPATRRAAEPDATRRFRIGARTIVGAGVLVIAIAVGIGIWLAIGDGSSDDPAFPGDSLVRINPNSGRADPPVDVGGRPSQVAVSGNVAWVGNVSDGSLKRVDPDKGIVVQSIPLPGPPDGVAVGGGSIWVATGFAQKLLRISPETNTIVQSVPVPNGPRGVAYGDGAVWVAGRNARTVTRIDGLTGRTTWTRPVGGSPRGIAYGAGAVWVTNETDATVSRIDPRTGNVQTRIPVGGAPGPVQVGADSVWVANTLDGTVSRIDPARNAVIALIPVGESPSSLAINDRDVWVANELDGTIMRIDPGKNVPAETIQTRQRPTSLALADGGLWVAARDASAEHRGGTLQVAVQGIDPTIDQIDFSVLSQLNLTGDGLTAYRRVAGVDGAGVVPDLATSIPTPTDGGRTYTFQVRTGVRYSNGDEVGPADFRRALERFYRLGSAPIPHYDTIVGAGACRARPRTCDLSRGIVVDEPARTVTFHLSKPDPNLLHSLALPFAHAVAPGAPSTKVTTRGLPATGPYVVTSYRPGQEISLVRNPHFREWSRAARPDGYPDEIVLTEATSTTVAVTKIESGALDIGVLYTRLPPEQVERLSVRYPERLHPASLVGARFIVLNTTRPPFDSLDARRAVAFAIDRDELIRVGGASPFVKPTCQVLPPDFPAYEPYCPFTKKSDPTGVGPAPDLAEAKRLVARSGTSGSTVVVRTWPEFAREARHLAGTLRELGYRASARVSSGEEWLRDAYEPQEHTPIQIGLSAWAIDLMTPSTFFEQLRCGSADPSRFCDPAIDRQMDEALTVQVTDPAAADRLWAGVDRALTDQAPWIGWATLGTFYFRSARTGNYQEHPVWTLLVDQLWVE